MADKRGAKEAQKNAELDEFDLEVEKNEKALKKQKKKSIAKIYESDSSNDVKPQTSKKPSKRSKRTDSDDESVIEAPKKKVAKKSKKAADSDDERPKKKTTKKRSKIEAEPDVESEEDVKPKKKVASKKSDEPTTSKKKNQRQSIPPSQNPKIQIPTKTKKLNEKKNAPAVDQSSEVKDSEHPFPFFYEGKTYYCKSLPPNFQQQWDGICEMRKGKNAPVDSMGAGILADKNESPEVQRFQNLISIIISAQTADERTAQAMGNLKNYGLNIQNMIDIDIDKLASLIKPCNNNNNKAKYIRETAQILLERYDGDVPRSKADIMTLPGCGEKVTNLAMWSCWGENVGLAIDTHMERIFYRLRWTNERKRDKQIKEIQAWMPKIMWPDSNTKIVGFGQTICESRSPKCTQCLITSTCRYYQEQF